MSSEIYGATFTDITEKWELAKQLTSKSGLPKEALEYVFDQAIQRLQDEANIVFAEPIRKYMWEVISKERLKQLNEKLLLLFCQCILKNFNQADAREMLKEYILTSKICNPMYSAPLQVAYQQHNKELINSIYEEAKSMTNTLVPEMALLLGQKKIKPFNILINNSLRNTI